MNTTVLHADDDGRYGEFRLDDEDLVVYDRENPGAWIRVESPAVVEGQGNPTPVAASETSHSRSAVASS